MNGGATERVMADTNVLVYCYDVRDPIKHRTSVQLIQALIRSERLVLSVQSLNEFYVTVTHRKLGHPLAADQAAQIIHDYIQECLILPITGTMTLAALQAVEKHGLAFWDALIWAAARQAGVNVIYSEDFQHGREVEGIRFLNPFQLGSSTAGS